VIRLISRAAAVRTAVIVAVLAGSLIATAGPVGAWQLVGTDGLVGPYGMVDNTNRPMNAGALCHYVGSPTDYFRSMSIRHPVARARNVSGQEDHQIVGWIARLQKATSPSWPWRTVRTSPEEKATAWQSTPATFHDRTLTWQSPNPSVIYRSLVAIKWYRAGSVEGRVTLRIQFYRYDAPDASPENVQQDYCQNVTD
jgi:hypothetical protein